YEPETAAIAAVIDEPVFFSGSAKFDKHIFNSWGLEFSNSETGFINMKHCIILRFNMLFLSVNFNDTEEGNDVTVEVVEEFGAVEELENVTETSETNDSALFSNAVNR